MINMYKIDEKIGKYAVLGGAFLGGGGGGAEKEGLKALEDALKLGEILVRDIEDFDDNDIILTASAVGSPASKEGFISPKQIIDNFELFKALYGKEIAGIITNENGGYSTTNGWILSAAIGIPLVDAPCNGRAHPTGVMGSMGLENIKEYISAQAASGGKNDREISVFVKSNMDSAAKMVRQAAVESGGLITVLRNPIEAAYVKKNAAPGALKQAIDVGRIFAESENPLLIIEGLKEIIGLEVIAEGVVSEYELTIEGGFDYGYIKIKEEGASDIKAYFWNEFMAVDGEDKRIATFPDLIGCIDAKTGKILTSATIRKNDEIYLYKVAAEKLILGAGMKNISQFELIEKILGIEVVKYAF
jgi:hypothetical protein